MWVCVCVWSPENCAVKDRVPGAERDNIVSLLICTNIRVCVCLCLYIVRFGKFPFSQRFGLAYPQMDLNIRADWMDSTRMHASE